MKRIAFPSRSQWNELLKRPAIDTVTLQQQVKAVMDVVRQDGDKAVLQFTRQFDGVQLESFEMTEAVINQTIQLVPDDLKRAIKQAAHNIRIFHEQQKTAVEVVETMKGIRCWRKSVGIEKVGLYIPGGTAPLFSTILMLGIPAQIAGCKEIILCSPPDKSGKLHPAIVYAANLVGITRIFTVGGVQAIAAMAYGTATIPQVYKIFGPGNQYVTCAKQLVQQDGIAIDMPAGPSEVCVLADHTANPAFVAADLLSQAEHGTDSQVLLVSTDNALVDAVVKELDIQLQALPRKEMAAQALINSKAVIVKDIAEAIDLVNQYAAEHLIISCERDEQIAEKIINAGSVFLGNYSPESVGDYASGTNHTLPTNGYARAYSGVSVDSFVKKITYQKLTKEGLLSIAGTVAAMADAEGLEAHKNAVLIRQ
ncbi:histidinol dehydrogenase [Sediminibacterium goheungense]|uniref:Histidinol dehydrogenase n=1 Tax=Sediminibacterium goheungense TaxID=1086393 RepID=A0A4R6IZX9_9BACT|nr:histidinol dehydrogenase [Sediminibacterium goheungense]TDO28460.1 histidinol dehydrogenase [Sediminibacterium goheungense]